MYLHVSVIGGLKLLTQRVRTAPFAAVGIVLLREDDPGAPSDLIEVDVHVHSFAQIAFVALILHQLGVPHGLTSPAPLALVRFLPAHLFTFGVK